MFTDLLKYAKSAKEALSTAFSKRAPNPPPEPGEVPPEQPKASEPDKSSDKPKPPLTGIVILGVVLVAALYIELKLLAVASGILLALVLIGYLFGQKVADVAGTTIPDPGDNPKAWPWPKSSDGAA
jgi:hypothetical protein